jgi:hypothetical protein
LRREAPRKFFDFGTVKTVGKHEMFVKLEQSRREAPREIFDFGTVKLLKSMEYFKCTTMPII